MKFLENIKNVMSKIVKTALKIFVICLLIIILYFILLVLSISIWNYFYEEVLNNSKLILLVLGIPLFLTIIIFIVICVISKKNNISILELISENKSKITLIILISCFSISSIINAAKFDLEKYGESLLTLEWCVFGITLALIALTLPQFKEFAERQRIEKIEEFKGVNKIDSYFDFKTIVEARYIVIQEIIFISINCFFLIESTSNFYLNTFKSKTIINLMLLMTLFITTNTFFQILLDMLKPYILCAHKLSSSEEYKSNISYMKKNNKKELLKKAIVEEINIEIAKLKNRKMK